jgi:hypothetical protein
MAAAITTAGRAWFQRARRHGSDRRVRLDLFDITFEVDSGLVLPDEVQYPFVIT